MKNEKEPRGKGEVGDVSWLAMFVVMMVASVVGTGLVNLIIWAGS